MTEPLDRRWMPVGCDAWSVASLLGAGLLIFAVRKLGLHRPWSAIVILLCVMLVGLIRWVALLVDRASRPKATEMEEETTL